MNTWYALPSAMPADEFNAAMVPWKMKGYRIAVFRDPGQGAGVVADIVVATEQYRGWYAAVNFLYRVIQNWHNPEWIVAGGDDMSPDPNFRADEIAAQCSEHFNGTFGVMQPVGDPWGPDERGLVAAERICGSPWVGRDFIRRYNGGRGVWCEDYRHFFGDERLHDELVGAGLLWQRRDLCQFHSHWMRVGKQPPPWMKDMREMWAHDEALFKQHKAAGFPRESILEKETAHEDSH